ncbi:sugar phosphate isomerase/epimerase family protein [Rhodococcus sp. NPDC059968]|uniref:sugar phosphate isomerase/epimerase family protein n=1 Tax=Rhodococcus sp. NPDC059968 TaxID=3347017 RepID=UPI00366A8970
MTTTTKPELLAACWTSAGDVMPARGPDCSPVPIRDRIEAVARAGYTGFGLTRPDLVATRETIGLGEVAKILADNGITHVQLEWITNWWTTGEARGLSDQVRRDLFEAAPVLGVDNIKVGADDDGVAVSRDRLCEQFDALATDGAAAGVKIAFENTPFSHHVKTTEQAAQFVKDVDNPNGGLILDIWHAFRGGTDYDLLPELIPSRFVFGVELDDGWAAVRGTDLEDTFDNRVPCGEGVFDVPKFINALRRIGFDGPWGIEHMSEEFRQLPVADALTRARDAALQCFEIADQFAAKRDNI